MSLLLLLGAAGGGVILPGAGSGRSFRPISQDPRGMDVKLRLYDPAPRNVNVKLRPISED